MSKDKLLFLIMGSSQNSDYIINFQIWNNQLIFGLKNNFETLIDMKMKLVLG